MTTRLLALRTEVPAHVASQERLAAFQARVLEAGAPSASRERAIALADRVFSRSGVRQRASVLADYVRDDPAEFEFFPRRWDLEPFPTIGARMARYERESVGLAERAARGALASAGLEPTRVTHLVVCTCTGFFAPGPDVALVERLGLRSDVSRHVLGFMGCYAGVSGARLADAIVRGESDAVVLQVCVELCSLHFQKALEPDFIVANALFADGCAAAVFGSAAQHGAGLLGLRGGRCAVAPDTADRMSWRIGDHGFEMRLADTVPAALEDAAAGFVDGLLASHGLGRGEVAAWAIHPGGPRIVETLARALSLDASQLAPSLGVLADHGNMSSPTIFFVIERLLEGGALRGPTAALGFGPGLTMEGLALVP